MADLKISQLTGASTPLAGTEVLPIVQSGSTKQVSVANLTAGRAVSGTTFTGTNTIGFQMTNAGDQDFRFAVPGVADWRFRANYASGNLEFNQVGGLGNLGGWTLGGNFYFFGNATVGTAAKGINFTANTPAAGKTSQLLNWYEEGTWTPAQGGGLTVVGAFSSTGRYTRIGQQVTVSGTVTGATSVAVTAAGIVTTNLPFTVVTAGHGNATNAAVNASAAVICTTTNVTSASAIAATGTITFSATYFV